MSEIGAGVWCVGVDADVFDCAGADIFDEAGATEGFYERGDLLICAGNGGRGV